MLILLYLIIVIKRLVAIITFGNTYCTNTLNKIRLVVITRFLFSV